MLGQERHIEYGFLVQQFVHFVLYRLLVSIEDARIEEHHLAVGQRNDAVPKSGDNFAIRSGDGFDEVLCESSVALDFGIDRRSDPDEAVVAQNDRGSAWQIVEMGFAAFDQRREDFDEDTLGELDFHKICLCKIWNLVY